MAERRACEIRLRAERKAGQILAKMEKPKGGKREGAGRPKKDAPPKAKSGSRGPTLKSNDAGISKQQSSQWQKLAKVPEEQFEAALAQADKLSTGGILAVGSR
jgi:hypothetical protein